MRELTPEERGVYNGILDLIYATGNKLPDDSRFVAGQLQLDGRLYRRVRARLLALGKLYIEGGIIRNRRADVEVQKATLRLSYRVANR